MEYLPAPEKEGTIGDKTNETNAKEIMENEVNKDISMDSYEETNNPDTEQNVRRSIRERKMPKQLTYPQLGNPLNSVVQSLFQSLSEEVTGSIELHEIKVV